MLSASSEKCRKAARAKGVQLHVLKAGTESEVDAAFATLLQQHAGALVVAADPFFNSRREQLVALAARHAVPAIYEWREFATAGGLNQLWKPASARSIASRHLHREDLEGRQASRSAGAATDDIRAKLVNLKTAQELGLTVPPSILAAPTRSSNKPHRRQTLIRGRRAKCARPHRIVTAISDRAVPSVRRASRFPSCNDWSTILWHTGRVTKNGSRTNGARLSAGRFKQTHRTLG